ncbi:MAG: 4-(cytidine 5'-diphospho)-2-C-methyl-D-erythritol kinase [Butyricicoccus pullicaecorum]|nr:4-(cytidine 5'-diphospho)-2-C-methyl-D-erythritol kinase [Butyricicoccus pullicaecorum]
MESLTLPAYAKINLTLDVTGKLPNGYHTVRMVMDSVDLHDDVTITKNTCNQITLSCNRPYVPTDDRNLAVRAAHLFFEQTGILCSGLQIDLVKRIPVAAGLAGGSTDAAAVLKGLNTLYQTGYTLEKLCEMGVRLGADVPYCLCGGTMLAEGIGQELTPIPAPPRCHIVLCKPDFSVSTAEVYAKMNGGDLPVHPDTNGLIQAIRMRDYEGMCHRLYNVMESVTAAKHEEIGKIKDILLSCGAEGAVMSGSGPTTFGLFQNKACAQKAYEILHKIFPETYLTQFQM